MAHTAMVQCTVRILCGIWLFLLLLEQGTAQSARDWWLRSNEFRTRYYNVKTDLRETHARHLAQHMDITYESYAELFAGLKAQSPKRLDLYLFASQEDYIPTLRARFNAEGTGSWGMAISRGSETSLVAWQGKYSLGDMESVLQHEGFHQFARYLFPELPSWANEGLAEIFQRGVPIESRIVLGEVTAQDLLRLAKANQDRKFRSFAQFFTMDQRVWNQHVQRGDANTNYLQAWCLVHFFLYADGAKYQPGFINFLVGLNQGASWQEAFVRAYGTPNFERMEKKWIEYIAQLQPTDYRQTIRQLDYLAAGMKELHTKEIYPLSFEELKQELRQISFQHTSKLFHQAEDLQTTDANFRIPAGTLRDGRKLPASLLNNSEKIVREFRLVDAKGQLLETPTDEKKREKIRRRLACKPLEIVTVGLEPRTFRVGWRGSSKRGFQPVFSVE